jgi:catechol 2,3-dioxygenase-like lactoylglutathione lyase family enzyme
MATSTETLGFHHVAVAASNFDRSKSFYDRVMGLLGLAPAIQATGYPHKETDGHLCIYAGKTAMFSLWEAAKDARAEKFEVYNVGLHHIAFAAPSRDAVDEFHRELKRAGVTILEAPAEYPYVPGFYAVYFSDPDGMKLEYAFTPAG